MADRAVSRISSNTEAAASEDLNQYRIAQNQFDAASQYVEALGSIEFWTKSKKMTTKWNKEAGVNWMS